MDDSEKIKALGDLCHGVPPRILDMLKRVEGLQSRSADTLERAAALRRTIEERIGELLDDVGELVASARTTRESATQLSTQLVEAVSNVSQVLTAQHEELTTHVEGLKTRSQDVVNNLESLFEKTDTRHGASKSAVTSALERIQEHKAQLLAAIAAVVEKCGSCDASLTEAREESGEQIDEALEQLDALEETLVEAAADIQEKMEELTTAFETKAGELSSDLLSGGVDSLIETGRQAIAEELQEALDEIVDELFSVFDDLIEKLTASGEESQELRELLEPIIEELMERFEPVEKLAEEVQEIADNLNPL